MITGDTRAALTRLSRIGERLRQRYRISPSDFNYLTERIVTNLPLKLQARRTGGWDHPWKTRVKWNSEAKEFQATVKPGYVNARDVEVRVPAASASQETLDRLGIRDAGRSEENVDAELHEEPSIPLPVSGMRSIGYDALPQSFSSGDNGAGGSFEYEPVPEFFLEKGVVAANPKSLTLGGGFQEEFQSGLPPKEERRYLRAIDIVLTQERPSAAAQWVELPGGTVEFGMTYTGSFNPEENRVFISRRKKFKPASEGVDPADLIRGAVGTDPFDEILVCTIYLLSPLGRGEGEEPDGSWTPYVDHSIFYNLNHASNRLQDQVFPEPLSFDIPLAAGVGNTLINNVLEANNERAGELIAILNASQVSGRFWGT